MKNLRRLIQFLVSIKAFHKCEVWFVICMEIGIITLQFLHLYLLWLLLGIHSLEANRKFLEIIYLCLGLFLIACTISLLTTYSHEYQCKFSMELKKSIICEIVEKILSIPKHAKLNSMQAISTKAINLDINRLKHLIFQLISVILSLFDISLSIALLFILFGISASIVPLIFVLFFVRHIISVRIRHQIYRKVCIWTEKRLTFISETLNALKYIKMMSLEEKFLAKISNMRENETKKLQRDLFMASMQDISQLLAPILASMCMFYFYNYHNKKSLESSLLLIAINLIYTINSRLGFLNTDLLNISQAFISIRRYLRLASIECLEGAQNSANFLPANVNLYMSNCSFKWNQEDPENNLSNINLSIYSGELVMVIGSVGSGKSNLLSSINGDMLKTNGVYYYKSQPIYVSQETWMQKVIWKDNITFLRPYYEHQYKNIVKLCALNGEIVDNNEITTGITNISGGQQARTALARAIYSDANLYLLDDPLASVDKNTAKSIYSNVIGPNGYLKEKTRIFITNSTDFLHEADKVIVMKNGKIEYFGKFCDMPNKFFANISKNQICTEAGEVSQQVDTNKNISTLVSSYAPVQLQPKKNYKKIIQKRLKKLFVSRKEASSSFFLYLTQFGVKKAISFLFIILALNGGIDALLWLWLIVPSHNKSFRVMILFCGAKVISMLFAQTLFIRGVVRAGNFFHRMLIRSILNLPLEWFQNMNKSAILGIFSNDIESIDNTVPLSLSEFSTSALKLVVFFITLLIIEINYSPIMIIYLILISLLAIVFLTKLHKNHISKTIKIRSVRFKRWSSILSLLNDAINGASVIRSCRVQHEFLHNFIYKFNQFDYIELKEIYLKRNFRIFIDFISNFTMLVLLTTFLFNSNPDEHLIDMFGLIITYSISMGETLRRVSYQLAKLETGLSSVQILHNFSELPQEKEDQEGENQHFSIKIIPSHPKIHKQGQITFENFSFRYKCNPDFTLKNLNFSINAGEKIGVVGRTGAGKSSLIVALLRLFDGETSGRLLIDDTDIFAMSLKELRTKFGVIPQDPCLFTETLHKNIDLFHEYSVDDVLRALKIVQLEKSLDVKDLLNYPVFTGSNNLSRGQQQLICAARALLQTSIQILIIDEGTSAMDKQIDTLMQSIIRKHFAHCTVFTIAHSINTIEECDRIMVMENGHVVELDTPQNLIRNTNSLFCKIFEIKE